VVAGSLKEIVVVPRGTLTTSGVSGGNAANASGNTPFENASGINAPVSGVSRGNIGANVNVSPTGAPPGQGRVTNNTGSANVSGGIPAARGPAAGGVAPSANTTGGAAGGNSLSNPSGTRSGAGGVSPPSLGQSAPAAPPAVQGISAAENQTFSPTGLSKPAEDGISTKIVPAKPCTSAARETDGTTTCVGIPSSPRR